MEAAGLLLPWPAQATRLEFFPLFFLLAIELAWQRFNGNVVLLTEVPPEDEAQIKCAGFVGDDVVYRWLFLLRHNLSAPSVLKMTEFSRFPAVRSLRLKGGTESV